MRPIRIFLSICIFFSIAASAQSDTLGSRLERFNYPYPVKYIHPIVENETVDIAYMDEKPLNWNGKTIVLMHGKNFPSAYWGNTIAIFTGAGYRVIAPDALGFGKSSKPLVQYSFSLLALLTQNLLDSLQIPQVAILGHSTGGMLAARFALAYPGRVTHLILADAIGLEDWRADGAPYRSVNTWFLEEQAITYEQVLNNQKKYYATWNEQYRLWADVQYGMAKGPDASQYAMVSARLYDMIFTQPVMHEFSDIQPYTLVIVGREDKTKIARDAAPEIAEKMGNYPKLGKRTANAIPRSKLIVYTNCGHLPFFEKENLFHKDVLQFLKKH